VLIRGLLVSAQGFLFIFLSGFVIAFFLRRFPKSESGLVWLGALAFLVILLPTRFLLSLFRQLALLTTQGETSSAKLTEVLVSSALMGFSIELSKLIVLKLKRVAGEGLPPAGVPVALGGAMITKIFHGLFLIGVGMRLLFGDTSTALLQEMAATPLATLGLGALASIVDRLALLALNALLGSFVALAVLNRKLIIFIYACLLHMGFELIYNFLGVTLEGQELLSSSLAFLFEGAVVIFASWWLIRNLPAWEVSSRGKRTRKRGKGA